MKCSYLSLKVLFLNSNSLLKSYSYIGEKRAKTSIEYYLFLSNLYQEKLKYAEIKNDEHLQKIAELESKLKYKTKCIWIDTENKATKLLEAILNKLNNLFTWNIMFSEIQNPVILKSGHTVDETTFNRMKKDPYDRTK